MREIKRVSRVYTNREGREFVILYFVDGTEKTIAYARYLMQCHLGRELDPNEETVDHIDGNKLNNELSNLRIISRSQHSKEDAKRINLIEFTCVGCGNIGRRKANHLDHNAKQGKAGPFCGKSCAGKYGRKIQMKTINVLPSQPGLDKSDRKCYNQKGKLLP